MTLLPLSTAQLELLASYQEQLVQLNQRFNLISPATEPYVAERHLRHCLALTAKSFPAGHTVVDWGTGGGLPAIPLAIAFPEVSFVAVDSVGKKVQAIKTMARRLGLTNLEAWHGRAEAWPGRLTYSVSRATAPLIDLWTWHTRAAEPAVAGAEHWTPGLICLKGGDLRDEIGALTAQFPEVDVRQIPLQPMLGGAYFAEKVVVECNVQRAK